MSDLSRVEQLLRNALGEDIYEVTPQSRVEALLVELNELIEGMGGSVSPEDIATAVAAYLDEHLTNPTSPPIDTSLTIAGAAADSKKVGDELSTVKEDFTDMVNSAYVTDSASGSVVHFVDGADNVPVKSLKVNIEPVQSGSGDPSPENDRPISGWDSVKVRRAGKNILSFPNDDYKAGSIVKNGVTFTVDSVGKITLNGTAGSAGNFSAQLVCGVYDGDDIVGCILNGCPSGGENTKYRIIVQENVSPWETQVTDFGDGAIVPETVIGKKVRVVVQVRQGYTADNLVFLPMLRHISDTDDTYEPYTGKTYEVSLASASTVYGGTLDAVSGVLTVDRAMITLNGTQNIANISARTNSVRFTYGASAQCKQTGVTANDVICDKLPSILYTWGTDQIAISLMEGYNRIVCGVPISAGTADTDIKTWLAANPLQIVYKLAEPQTVQLSAQEIKSLLGINNVWSDAGDVEVEYRADTKLYINKKIAEALA